jgi:hypothetical protein
MHRRGGGAIVFTSSVSSCMTRTMFEFIPADLSAYMASKAAINVFVRSTASRKKVVPLNRTALCVGGPVIFDASCLLFHTSHCVCASHNIASGEHPRLRALSRRVHYSFSDRFGEHGDCAKHDVIRG